MDNVAGLASGATFEGVIKIEEEKIRSHVGEMVRQTVDSPALPAERQRCGTARGASTLLSIG